MVVIDLSVSIYSGMKVYPGDPEVSVDVAHTYKDKGWQLRKITMGSHTGTHVDAFSHMDEKGKKLDEIPLDCFFGESYIANAEEPFPVKSGLFFLSKVGLESFEQIIRVCPLFVGGEIDQSLEKALLCAGIITYTNLINLDLLPTDRSFMFYGFPLKIRDGDGSPVRAVAVIGI